MYFRTEIYLYGRSWNTCKVWERNTCIILIQYISIIRVSFPYVTGISSAILYRYFTCHANISVSCRRFRTGYKNMSVSYKRFSTCHTNVAVSYKCFSTHCIMQVFRYLPYIYVWQVSKQYPSTEYNSTQVFHLQIFHLPYFTSISPAMQICQYHSDVSVPAAIQVFRCLPYKCICIIQVFQ